MSFMEPEIYRGRYVEVETSTGNYFIPEDALLWQGCPYWPGQLDLSLPRSQMTVEEQRIASLLWYYVDGEPLSAVWREGLLGRLSAPGYLDATEWAPYDSEEAALQDLLGEEESDEDESDEEDSD